MGKPTMNKRDSSTTEAIKVIKGFYRVANYTDGKVLVLNPGRLF